MSTIDTAYVTMWRFKHGSSFPEQVRVLPVSHDYVLVEGETNTSYAGGFFDDPEKAYERAIEDEERWIRMATRRRDDLVAARERFRSGDWVGGKKRRT